MYNSFRGIAILPEQLMLQLCIVNETNKQIDNQ